MSLNWKELDQILSELPLEGSQIQKAEQTNVHTITFGLYHPGEGRYNIAIVLSQQGCRISRTPALPAKAKKKQRFAQLLNSRVIGGRVVSAAQIGGDRIVRLGIQRGEEFTVLYIKLWGGASNVLLCSDDDTIIDACYRRPGKGESSGNIFSPVQRDGDDSFTVRSYPEGISFNTFIEQHYRSREILDECTALSRQARAILDEKHSRLLSRLSKMEQQILEDGSQARMTADLVAAHIHLVKAGMVSVTLEDFYHDNQLVEIPLDPALPPGEQAQRYYQLAKKQERTREHHLEDLDDIRRQLSDITRLRAQLLEDHECSEEHAGELRRFISSELSADSRTSKGEPACGLQFRSGAFLILVGRNSRENDLLLRNRTRGNDYWLHTRDYPGGYVFIKHIPGKSVPLETILDAAHLAVHYSKARRNGKADLYYTQVKYLRRAKHGKTGTVLPTREKNLFVEVEPHRLARLLGGES